MSEKDAMERVSTKQAAAELKMDIDTLHYLLQKDRLPIGYAVKKDGKMRTNYVIYRGLLEGYKRRIQMGGEEKINE